ncbi:putative phage tail protein [Dysosmobacter sp.]|uniref:putative phage tail protein n=1 Tax=Dysosmobacter sp. TaxID=2591382 RepID=UPI003AF05798
MELLDYLPDFMAGLKEMQELTKAEQPEIAAAIRAVRTAPDEFFITTLSPAGAKRWEEMLALPVQESAPIADRRFRILTKATEQRPFTLRRLKELMTTLCGEDGFTVAMVGSTFTLTVRVMLKVRQNYDDVETLLNRIVPENLVLDLSLMYNQHQTLAAFTHAQLAAYTHYFLRNEVLPHGNN